MPAVHLRYDTGDAPCGQQFAFLAKSRKNRAADQVAARQGTAKWFTAHFQVPTRFDRPLPSQGFPLWQAVSDMDAIHFTSDTVVEEPKR